jgi:heat shock protein HspQ
MTEHEAKFQVGDVVYHELFDYLGVVFDVDAVFGGSDEWYAEVARSRPPKNKPWYHVLVDQAVHTTYVAEQNLASAADPQPIRHPLTAHYFGEFDGKKYPSRRRVN